MHALAWLQVMCADSSGSICSWSKSAPAEENFPATSVVASCTTDPAPLVEKERPDKDVGNADANPSEMPELTCAVNQRCGPSRACVDILSQSCWFV
jgi:hypothetical protein